MLCHGDGLILNRRGEIRHEVIPQVNSGYLASTTGTWPRLMRCTKCVGQVLGASHAGTSARWEQSRRARDSAIDVRAPALNPDTRATRRSVPEGALNGTVVISVPIETGPAFLMKYFGRKFAAWRGLREYGDYETYSARDAARMVFANESSVVCLPAATVNDSPDGVCQPSDGMLGWSAKSLSRKWRNWQTRRT
jgi:hypothetical protein